MGSKNKGKKLLRVPPKSSPPPPPVEPTMEDDELMEELMAQLDSKDSTVQGESATILKQMNNEQNATAKPSSVPHDSKSRHKARQARKAAALAEKYSASDPAEEARLQREADDEVRAINHMCHELGVEIYPINPDGHCLFSAVADQLILLGRLPPNTTYTTVRHAAADYIAAHPDNFLPFLPATGGEDTAGATDEGLMSLRGLERYCATMRDTGAWGGEPEILALSRAFEVPVHVVQGGTPPVVIHTPSGHPGSATDKHVVRISYHRHMYGLGEHYNSLRPKTGLAHAIKSAFTS